MHRNSITLLRILKRVNSLINQTKHPEFDSWCARFPPRKIRTNFPFDSSSLGPQQFANISFRLYPFEASRFENTHPMNSLSRPSNFAPFWEGKRQRSSKGKTIEERIRVYVTIGEVPLRRVVTRLSIRHAAATKPSRS